MVLIQIQRLKAHSSGERFQPSEKNSRWQAVEPDKEAAGPPQGDSHGKETEQRKQTDLPASPAAIQKQGSQIREMAPRLRKEPLRVTGRI